MGKEKELITTIKNRKVEYIGHITRNNKRYKILQHILQGKIEGKRNMERRRLSWLKDLRDWYNKTLVDLFRASFSNDNIVKMLYYFSSLIHSDVGYGIFRVVRQSCAHTNLYDILYTLIIIVCACVYVCVYNCSEKIELKDLKKVNICE